MTPPLTRFPQLDQRALNRAAADGDVSKILSMLDGWQPSVDVTDQCVLALTQGAWDGQLTAVDALLPWTQERGRRSPATHRVRYNNALTIAINKGYLAIVQQLFPFSEDCRLKTSVFIQQAAIAKHYNMVRWLVPFSDLTTVHDTLTKKKDPLWTALDVVAQEVDATTRMSWVKAHKDHLPNAQAMVTAARRADKAAGTSDEATGPPRRRRGRP